MMHVIPDIRCFKISLFCLLLFNYVILHYLMEKFSVQEKILTVHRKIIRIVVGVRKSVCCRELFTKFNIHPLASEYVLS